MAVVPARGKALVADTVAAIERTETKVEMACILTEPMAVKSEVFLCRLLKNVRL